MIDQTNFRPGEEPPDAIPVIVAQELARRGNKKLVVIVALNGRTMQMEYTEAAYPGYETIVDAIIESVQQSVKHFADPKKGGPHDGGVV